METIAATLTIAAPQLVGFRWSDGGRSLLDAVNVGDLVSVHWDWVCDILSPDGAAAIEGYEQRQLDVTNAILVAGSRPS